MAKTIRVMVRPECVERVIKENFEIQKQFEVEKKSLVLHHGSSVRHAGKGWGT